MSHTAVLCGMAAVALSMAFGVEGTATAQNRQQRPAPLAVTGFRGQYCASMGPQGWRVIAENPQRVSFGADAMSYDGKAAVGYTIFGAAAGAPMRGMETPDRAVAFNLSRMGALRVQFGQKRQVDRNVYEVSYQTQEAQGMAFYQVFPMGGGGWTVLMRTAYVPVGAWSTRGAEASAVARSMHCQVPSTPPAPDPPSLNPKTKPAAAKGEEGGESDSLYNVWLDKEYYHDPQSGQNFWVSPSSDYSQTGAQGPGYYAQHGNEIIKLESGYAQ